MKRSLRRKKPGSALVMTLAIIVLVTVIAVGYLATVTLESRVARMSLDEQRAATMAEIGLNSALARLRDALGPWDDPYANFCAIAHSPFDLTITFCDVQPLSPDDIRHAEATETVRAPIVARIAVPFTVVPGIINALTEHMRAMQGPQAPESSPSWPGSGKGPLH